MNTQPGSGNAAIKWELGASPQAWVFMSEEKNEFGTTAGNAADDLDSTFQLISRARAGDQGAIERCSRGT